MLALTGCGDKQAPKEVKTYKYTVAEVYEKTCIKCHGKNGEGNPLKKTPSLSDKTAGELAQDLYDIKNGGNDNAVIEDITEPVYGAAAMHETNVEIRKV